MVAQLTIGTGETALVLDSTDLAVAGSSRNGGTREVSYELEGVDIPEIEVKGEQTETIQIWGTADYAGSANARPKFRLLKGLEGTVQQVAFNRLGHMPADHRTYLISSVNHEDNFYMQGVPTFINWRLTIKRVANPVTSGQVEG